jgi:hypothetical protein
VTGNFPLDWATQAVSLFNAIILLWLGLTVLLNAERRTLGLWIAGGQLLMGAAFFLSHSIILGYGQSIFNPGVNFWWHLGWIPVVSLPYAWYGVMLWYAGFWSSSDSPGESDEPAEPGEPGEPDSPLRRRHRLWFALDSALAALIIGLLVFANPLPSFSQVAQLQLNATPPSAGSRC